MSQQPTITQQIGQRLEQERKRLGLTAIKVYTALDIHQNTFANYEDGKRDIPANLLSQLWEMGFDVLYIITGTHAETTNQTRIFSSNQIDELLKLATLLEKPCFDETQKQIIADNLTLTFNQRAMTSDEQLEYLKNRRMGKTNQPKPQETNS